MKSSAPSGIQTTAISQREFFARDPTLFVRYDPRLGRLESGNQAGFLLGRELDGFVCACEHVTPSRQLSQLLRNVMAIPLDTTALSMGQP